MSSSLIPLQKITDAVTQEYGINLYVLRTDLNHPHISGNKFFKLKYNLEEAKSQNKNTLLTFGGAYSNHIAATAAAGKENGLKTIGIIRGDELKILNPTLRFAVDCGMELKFISREKYKIKNTIEFHNSLAQEFENSFIIPEGGANELGIKGCVEISEYIPIDFDKIFCACGTGATLAGIILSLKEHQNAIGFQILKGKNYIRTEVSVWLNKSGNKNSNWQINEEFHFGGYAKWSDELIAFIQQFEKENNIPLEYIYTGKMMFGIYVMMKQKVFRKGETLIAVHTGGLQK